MEENNLSQEQSQKIIWMVTGIITLVAVIIGGFVFTLQFSSFKSTEKSLRQDLAMLQNQINQLQQAQQVQLAPIDQQNPTESTQATEEQVESGAQPSDQAQTMVYNNSKYGFSLTFPQTWDGYTTKSRKLNWGDSGTSDSIDFGYSTQTSLFNISVLTKNQWKQIKSQAGPKPTYLGENDLYVFGYSTAQDAVNNTIISRMKEIPEIVKTFEVLE